MSDFEISRIAHKLADIMELREEKKNKKSKQEQFFEKSWWTGDIMLVCQPCMKYNQHPEVPPMMRTSLRGAAGTVKRWEKKGRMRSNHILMKVCKRHEKTNLHIWCDIKEKQEVEKKQTFKIRNEEAGLSVVRTAIKTMK